MSRTAHVLRGGLATAALLAGCGPAGDESAAAHPHAAALRQQIRPTDGDGWYGNGYGIPALSYDSAGGHFRVFYVTSTMSAVEPADVDPMDGVPDFVQQVAAAAELTYESTITRRGFRPPLDDSKYHDRPDYGGDARFDIYLRRVGDKSDGYRVIEACTDGTDGSPDRCAGYFVMNASFAGSHYPSQLDAIQVLTSHELFHNVQDAYNVGQWRTWTEGTATWNELQTFPDSLGTWRDYLGFLKALFREPERPFDKSMGSDPTSSYPYAVAAWAEYLSERFGPLLIREIWEGCEIGPDGKTPEFLDVTDALLKNRYQSSLVAAWTEFTRWNLLTAERADGKRGYKRAAEYPAVRMEEPIAGLNQSTEVEINGLAARYLRFSPGLTAPQTLRLSVHNPGVGAVAVSAYTLAAAGGVPGQERPLSGDSLEVAMAPGESLLVVVSGATRGARSHQVTLRLDVPEAPLPPPPPPIEEGGCQVAALHAAPGAFGWTLWCAALLAGVVARRRRRQDG